MKETLKSYFKYYLSTLGEYTQTQLDSFSYEDLNENGKTISIRKLTSGLKTHEHDWGLEESVCLDGD